MSAGEKRTYDGRGRAAQAEARREEVLEAAVRLFSEQPFEDVTLQAVADSAGVALKTVVRQFGTKDALFLECARKRAPRERDQRRVEVGDVVGAARVLAERYDGIADLTMRYLVVAPRFDSVAQMIEIARGMHLEWLGEIFAPWLPTRDTRERKERLAQLFAATEIYVWWVWRRKIGLDAKTCENAMRSTLEALVASWTARGAR